MKLNVNQEYYGGDVVEAFHIASDKKRPFMIIGSVNVGTKKKKYTAVPMSRTNLLFWTSYELDKNSYAHCNRLIELDSNQIFSKLNTVSEDKFNDIKARVIGNLSTMKYQK